MIKMALSAFRTAGEFSTAERMCAKEFVIQETAVSVRRKWTGNVSASRQSALLNVDRKNLNAISSVTAFLIAKTIDASRNAIKGKLIRNRKIEYIFLVYRIIIFYFI